MFARISPPSVACLVLCLATPLSAEPQDADASVAAFEEGDVIPFEQIEKLKPFLPEEFWNNRDFFFYDGMQLEIGPAQRDYSPAPEWNEMTERLRGQARIGPDNSLENWSTGFPFPQDEIDCLGDPQAGVKIIWDFRAPGGDGEAHFFYSYWERGEKLPLGPRREASALLRRDEHIGPARASLREEVREEWLRHLPRREAQVRVRCRSGGALRRARDPAADVPL